MKELTARGEFRSVYHRARINVLYTAICIRELDRKFMSLFDLTPQQHNILRIVYHHKKPLNVLQIRDRMFEKLSDASRLIDRLEMKDLLKKEKSKEDKRLVEISLTEKGLALVERIDENLDNIDKYIN